MFTLHGQYCIIYGNNNYISDGLKNLIDSEISRYVDSNLQNKILKISLWSLDNVNLMDVLSFSKKRANPPDIIICNEDMIRFFSKIPLFKQVILVDVRSPIRNIKSVIYRFLTSRGSMLQRYDRYYSPYTSLKQKEILSLLLKGHSPLYCSRVLNVSYKMISHHKRILMKSLGVRSNQELMVIVGVTENFLKCISSDFI